MNRSWSGFLAAHGATFDRDGVVSFGNATAELVAARDSAVVCELSALAVLRVEGADAEAFLQGQFTNDVARLGPGDAQYSAWCSPKGRMLANFLLRRAAEAAYELLLPASLAEAVAKRLRLFVLRSRVSVIDSSDEGVRLGIGGPGAGRAIAALGRVPGPGQVVSSGDVVVAALAGPRYAVLVAAGAAPSCWDRLCAVGRPAGFAVWRWLTIRAGVPVVTPPTTDLFVPQAANWDALGGISFQKGCYTGQEIVARTQYLGRLKERLVLGHADGPAPTAGARLYSAAFGEQACGTIVDAAVAPGGGCDLLAVLQLAAAASDEVRIDTRDGPALRLLSLPYELPAPPAARGRIA